MKSFNRRFAAVVLNRVARDLIEKFGGPLKEFQRVFF